MIYLKDAPIDWSPLNVPAKRVPGHVVENQRVEGSPVYIRLDGNLQLLMVAPERVCPRGRWDGHEWDPNGRLGAKPAPPGPLVEMPLPTRLALAARDAIEDQAIDVYTNQLGHTVYGFTADMARYSAGAVVEALAAALLAQRCCAADSVVCCSSCLVLQRQAAAYSVLAQQVRDVPAVEVA